MADRLISADVLNDEICRWRRDLMEAYDLDDVCATCFRKVYELIDNAPTVEAELVKHGRWIHDGHHIRCSNCEVYFCDKDREGDTLPTNYCPNCGAKMDLDEVEE